VEVKNNAFTYNEVPRSIPSTGGYLMGMKEHGGLATNPEGAVNNAL